MSLSMRDSALVSWFLSFRPSFLSFVLSWWGRFKADREDCEITEAKAKKEMADKAKGKGPMNAGSQGIKKSGKK